jgi:four helix bundle suffix protein
MAKEQEYSKLFNNSGGFEKLLGYQIAEMLYDFTVRFTERYISAGSRTRDQMEQAARSGSQNIAEGSVFSATSKKLEMNLTNVSRASLTELQKDYAAFLRQRKLTIWTSSDPIRQELIDRRFTLVDEVARWAKEVNQLHPIRSIPEIAGNIGYIFSNVALALVNRQLHSQAKAFEKDGGFSERLYKFRSEAKGNDQRK